MIRDELLNKIAAERARHSDKPGSEMDVQNDVNQWAAIAAFYLFEEVRRGGHKSDRASFERSFIKAAAVILAALEHTDSMLEMGHLLGEKPKGVSFSEIINKIGER